LQAPPALPALLDGCVVLIPGTDDLNGYNGYTIEARQKIKKPQKLYLLWLF
jgi:hypothetical protein